MWNEVHVWWFGARSIVLHSDLRITLNYLGDQDPRTWSSPVSDAVHMRGRFSTPQTLHAIQFIITWSTFPASAMRWRSDWGLSSIRRGSSWRTTTAGPSRAFGSSKRWVVTGCPICSWTLVGLTLGGPPSWPSAQPLLPNSHQPRQN